MAIKYGRKKRKQSNIFNTVVTAFLLCTIFLSVVSYFFISAEEEAYETLHIQTKQIKDDIHLQLHSDFENLETMANFASKLHRDGESYDLLFESFKPIGLIANIGILTPDNVFLTKAGSMDLTGRISCEEEAKRGKYISGRIEDRTKGGIEIIRSAVPVKSGEKTIGILYGVIRLEALMDKYGKMSDELNAQLFLFSKSDGKLVMDTIDSNLENISDFKNRRYVGGYSYDAFVSTDKGYTSFISAYTGEQMYIHYSLIDEFGWMIMLARPESQVFEEAHSISRILLVSFVLIVAIIILYVFSVMKKERQRNNIMQCASTIRKLLLEINQNNNNVSESLKNICSLSKARSAIFTDTDGEDYWYIVPSSENKLLLGEDRRYFQSQLFKYAADNYKINGTMLGIMTILQDQHLLRSNPDFYNFMRTHSISKITFTSVTDKNNHVSILAVLNPANKNSARILLEEIAFCFSIAIYNKKHLSRTETAAMTDSLTGTLNRVSYKNDIRSFDAERPENFACVYIDVNELHMCNNKYGHAAGDAMLMYIANTLKEFFYGYSIYRMGGDEFLVFAKGIEQDTLQKSLRSFEEHLVPMDYHVAIGVSYRSQNTNTEEMVREAEVRMYEEKAKYYQNKEQKKVTNQERFIHLKTGIKEIDTLISVLKEKYFGIYRVSLDTNSAHRILMPAYLGYSEDESDFSALLSKYIEDTVNPDYHRSVSTFLNYEHLKKQLATGNVPRITFKKITNETVVLSVYRLDDSNSTVDDTLWMFARE